MPKGIPLTNQELEICRKEIAHAAGILILKKGFIETSVHQIAKAAGMGKSTLYDYFSSKEEILLYLLEEYHSKLIQQARMILGAPTGVMERLYQLMVMHLEVLREEKAYHLGLILEAQRLSIEGQRFYQQMRYEYQDRIQTLIEEGITQGIFRSVDSALVTKSLLAILTSVVFTTRPSGTPQQMLEECLDILLRGIQD